MVEILPVEDKLKQQAYCLQFDVHFELALMAYVALKDGEAVAICQFEISRQECDIRDLSFEDNLRQTPIPFLLLRAVVHFADGCGAVRMRISTENVNEELAVSAGFFKKRQGNYEVNLQNLRHQ